MSKPTVFVNEKRPCGCTTEGFGECAVKWYDYEVKCVDCKNWTREYGDVSLNMNEDGSEQGWLCPKCAADGE